MSSPSGVLIYFLSKRPANLFDGSYFFVYLCAMTTLQIIGLVFVIISLWMAFEMWRAPLYREEGNGTWTELEPPKKLSDLFKKKKK